MDSGIGHIKGCDLRGEWSDIENQIAIPLNVNYNFATYSHFSLGSENTFNLDFLSQRRTSRLDFAADPHNPISTKPG